MSRASDRREGRSWPGFLLGGRVRTSTVVLLIAFFATWWLFDTYQPAPAPPEQVPATEVVRRPASHASISWRSNR